MTPSGQFDQLIDSAIALAPSQDMALSAIVPASHRSVAVVTARQSGVVAGLFFTEEVLGRVSELPYTVSDLLPEGTQVSVGDTLARIEAGTHDLLRAELPMATLIRHCSGMATETARWVAAVDGTGACIRASRESVPGVGELAAYAVTVGGGETHHPAAVITRHHAIAAGGVVEAYRLMHTTFPDISCEVVVISLAQLDDLLAEEPAMITLDGLELWAVQMAVQRRNRVSPTTWLAATGLTIDTAADYARSGLDFVDMPSPVHSTLDVRLDVFPAA